MRTELDRSGATQIIRTLFIAAVVIFCYYEFLSTHSLYIGVGVLLVTATIIFRYYKKKHTLPGITTSYLLEFDEDFLYYSTSSQETKIPLGDITAINLDGFRQSFGFISYHPYKIVYTDFLEVKSIRFNVSYYLFGNNPFTEFKRLVEIKNPRLETLNVYFGGDVDFRFFDKVTDFINKVSGKIFRSKD